MRGVKIHECIQEAEPSILLDPIILLPSRWLQSLGGWSKPVTTDRPEKFSNALRTRILVYLQFSTDRRMREKKEASSSFCTVTRGLEI